MAKTDEHGNWLNKSAKPTHPELIRRDEKLKDELIGELILKADNASAELLAFKLAAKGDIEAYYALLLEKYDIDAKANTKKGNLTIANYSNTMKVQISNADNITFDEKLNIAKIKIDEYLHEVTENSSPDIKTLINKAFEVDKKGDVNAKKILALKGYNIEHPKWLEAMSIIDESIEIVSTKSYIRFYKRDSIDDEWQMINLDLAGV